MLACSMLLPALCFAASPKEKGGPIEVVDALHEVFLEVMKSATENNFEARLVQLDRIIDISFDLEFMALKVLGPRRRDLSAGELQRWVRSFSDFLRSNYARRFVGWSGQSFESLTEEPAPRDTVVVRTRLLRPKDDHVILDYRLRLTGEGWRVIDIYSNGNVSELALRRSEFAALFKEQGIDHLIKSVDKQSSQR